MWFGQQTYSGNVRQATHAGSWYSADAGQLKSQVDGWMETAKKELSASDSDGQVKAVIGPHAGFRYSGPTAAYSYAPIVNTLVSSGNIDRVVLIGPSHHAYLPTCEVSAFKQYETPFGRVDVDLDAVQQLKETGLFKKLSGDAESEEHSLEMHMPFLQRTFDTADRSPLKIVPILAGNMSPEKEAEAGKALASLLDNRTIVAVSTDFCHWGRRFGYDFYNSEWGSVHESITKLDGLGIEAIKTLDPKAYNDYQEKYKNTICGRHAVSVVLNALQELAKKENVTMTADFPHYAQSNAAKNMRDSSVSYSAGVVKVIN